MTITSTNLQLQMTTPPPADLATCAHSTKLLSGGGWTSLRYVIIGAALSRLSFSRQTKLNATLAHIGGCL
jgi:hypothetical protein